MKALKIATLVITSLSFGLIEAHPNFIRKVAPGTKIVAAPKATPSKTVAQAEAPKVATKLTPSAAAQAEAPKVAAKKDAPQVEAQKSEPKKDTKKIISLPKDDKTVAKLAALKALAPFVSKSSK